jgi:large subunit ribosomal protein L35
MVKQKLKTRKAAAKRFRVTGTGKIVHDHAGTIHFGRKRRGERKRHLNVDNVLQPAEAKRARQMLGKKK